MHLIRRFRLLFSLVLALVTLVPRVEIARATVNSQVNKTIVLGNSAQTQFTFNFIGVAAAYISVIYTDGSGNETVLTQGSGASQYQITLNAPVQGAIWGIGGTITYNPSGTPIAAGTTLTIFRTLPLTQAITLQNQSSIATLGKGSEAGLDTGVMQAQQINENIARAISVPVVDATAPLPLPPIAQRANQAMGFDSAGNPVAISAPSSGIISSAMQPVVDAATLALGRTAFGLGAMATEGIGAGLQDDGAGNARVNSLLVSVAINQSVDATFAQKTYIATGPITFTLPRANTLWNGFSFSLIAFTGPITFTPNASDNFPGLAGGTSYVFPQGSSLSLSTDGASTGIWYAQVIPVVQSPPQGYLTPCSASVVVSGCTVPGLIPTGDVTSVSTLYYQTAPAGNLIPVWNGATMVMVPFAELALTLNASHLANTIYDVCVSYNGGTPIIVTAPAWQTSTAGSGARGASAAITRKNGIWTNTLAITGRNGASTFSIAANQCTMVGSIVIDGSAGQVSATLSGGQSRKWGYWNFYNRQQITLRVVDPTASWTNTPTTWRQSHADATNFGMSFTGLAEEYINGEFDQHIGMTNGGTPAADNIGIGVNSTTSPSGYVGSTSLVLVGASVMQQQARVLLTPTIGTNQFNTLEQATSGTTNNQFNATSSNFRMTLNWRG